MSNCLYEATLQNIEKSCNCVPNFFANEAPGVDICLGQKKLCMNELMKLMGDKRTVIDNNGIEKVNCGYKVYFSRQVITSKLILILISLLGMFCKLHRSSI